MREIIDLAENVYVTPDTFLHSIDHFGRSPIDVYLPESVCERLGDTRRLKGIIPSYPVFKRDGDKIHPFEKEIDIDLWSLDIDVVDHQPVITLGDVLTPLLLEVWALCEEAEKNPEEYGTNHSFDELFVERLLFNPEDCSFKLELGS